MLGRLRRHPFPDVSARMGLSDSLVPVGGGYGSPRLPPTGRWLLVLGPTAQAATAAPQVGDGSPAPRVAAVFSRRDEGLPGAWAVLFLRAAAHNPTGCIVSSPSHGGDAVAFRQINTLGIRDMYGFRGYLTAARTLAHLRFASLVTETVARVASDWPGSALVGRDSHPLDGDSEFQALPHRTLLSDQPGLVAPISTTYERELADRRHVPPFPPPRARIRGSRSAADSPVRSTHRALAAAARAASLGAPPELS